MGAAALPLLSRLANGHAFWLHQNGSHLLVPMSVNRHSMRRRSWKVDGTLDSTTSSARASGTLRRLGGLEIDDPLDLGGRTAARSSPRNRGADDIATSHRSPSRPRGCQIPPRVLGADLNRFERFL